LHLAYFRGGSEDFEEAFRVNGEGTGLVLSHCRRAKAALVMSSHVMYTPTGDPSHRHREGEAVGGSISPASPTSSASKVAEEAVARYRARALSLPVTIPRLNTVYGPDPRYLPSMHALTIAAGKPVVSRSDHCPHTPIQIDDMVWQLEALLDAASVPATIVNWCGDSDVTVREWCEMASVASGAPLDLTVRTIPGAPCSNAADPTRRLALTGPCRGSSARPIRTPSACCDPRSSPPSSPRLFGGVSRHTGLESSPAWRCRWSRRTTSLRSGSSRRPTPMF
jgi:nucleoside-diphosphate-sugar epimerase